MLEEDPLADEVQPRIPMAERLGALAEVVLCSGFPTQIVILTAMAGFGMRLPKAAEAWSPHFVATLSLLDTTLVIGLVFLFLRAHRESAREVLLGRRAAVREVAVGLALLPIVFMLAVLMLKLVMTLAPGLHNVARNPMQDLMRNPRDAVLFGFVIVLAGGVREEIQRGFILHRFGQYLGGGAVGVAVHSVVFALGHVEQGWDAAIAVGTLGAIWGTIYLVRRSIIAPMVSHAGFNLTQVVNFMLLR